MSHAERLKKEIEFYNGTFRLEHPLNRYPFHSPLRNEFAYAVARYNLANRAKRLLRRVNDVLIAPCGLGKDMLEFSAVWPTASFSGIDISSDAVRRCVIRNAIVGDIMSMPFPDGTFDAVISTLFFHHVADEGFEPYLAEIARVLRPGGIVVTMEQSTYHPLFLLTRPAKKIIGNITGQVDHEHPISLSKLADSTRRSGFERACTFPCSFGHNRMPIPVTTMINVLNYVEPLKHFAWMMGLVAFKA
ncbi:MAG TPA: class I SAM-dependent methyltransferase [Nitrospira sp.]|nr:class I SAM-dependent methyltransferase [Nitrospira sp.]